MTNRRKTRASRRRRETPPRVGLDALRDRVERALASRARLLAGSDTDAVRLFHGATEGIDGLVIEKFADVLVVQLHEQRLCAREPEVRTVCAELARRLGARAVYCKRFARDRSAALARLRGLHTDPEPWIGTPIEPELSVVEHGVRYLIRPYDGYSVGLFLEHRDNRRRIRELARGRRVLNAFAYTCGFSVAAALGGAENTVSVDVSRRYLEWGKRNFATNRIDLNRHTFLCSDIFAYLHRVRRQGRRFDLVVLDPPTFGRSKRPRSVFAIAEDLDRLVAGAADLLSPGGIVLLATNHRKTSRRRLEAALRSARAGRQIEILTRPALPPDFAGDEAYAKAVLARLHEPGHPRGSRRNRPGEPNGG